MTLCELALYGLHPVFRQVRKFVIQRKLRYIDKALYSIRMQRINDFKAEMKLQKDQALYQSDLRCL